MLQNPQNRDIVVAALRHAAPYVRLYRRKTFVIKAGGEVFAEPASMRALIEQVAILHQVGIRTVLVHGGGPQNSRLAEALGIDTHMVEGRRVTDERTLEVTTMSQRPFKRRSWPLAANDLPARGERCGRGPHPRPQRRPAGAAWDGRWISGSGHIESVDITGAQTQLEMAFCRGDPCRRPQSSF